MLASELLNAPVADGSGNPCGFLRDLRFIAGSDAAADSSPLGPVVGIVVGRPGRLARLAHSWGYAEGRASGPLVLRRLFAGEAASARFVPVQAVASWDPECVRIAGRLDSHPRLAEELSR